ncbi:hypothetical protein OF820_05350 [Oceanotoga sp. DSM 15011]|uniref:hypothetical protein n=1 Tax=Oceanotoga sp. DSM 15011 TaxID=2984951 RepID=UPI0021F44E54|nr:hypothetical protein [Oceanotoga sp. DSM 15011]UYP01110.1 hypothetical protein OF820_05350 [Oceanotoga sp. DSM 15011]
MRKIFVFGLMIISILIVLSACNVEKVNVKANPKVQAPVGATSLSINEFIGNFEDELQKNFPSMIRVNSNPLTYRYATDIINISTDELFTTGDMDFSQFDFNQNISVSIPSIPEVSLDGIPIFPGAGTSTIPIEITFDNPNDLVSATINEGTLILSADNLTFSDATVTFNSNDVNTSIIDGNIHVNLKDQVLNGTNTVSLNEFDYNSTTNTFNINVSVSSDTEFKQIVFKKEGLNFNNSGSNEIIVPEEIKELVDRINLSSGELEFRWLNGMNVDFNANISSTSIKASGTDTPLNSNQVFTKNTDYSTSVIDLSNKYIDVSSGKINLDFDVEPAGYLNDEVTLNGLIKQGDNLSFDFSLGFKDIIIESIKTKNTTFSGKITSGIFNFDEEFGILDNVNFKTLPATLIINKEGIEGNLNISLLASYSGTSTPVISTGSSGNEFTGDFSSIFNEKPDNLEMLYSIQSDGLTIESGSSISGNIQIDIPIDITITKESTVLSYESEGDMLGRNDENRESINEALNMVENFKLFFKVEDTIGVKFKIYLELNENKYQIDFSSGNIQSIDLGNIAKNIVESDVYKVKVYVTLPVGDYSLNSDGKMDINLWAALDSDLNIPIKLKGQE